MAAGTRPKLVLADDHPEVLAELQEFLASEFEVARAVGNGHDLLRAVDELNPDAVISDIRMPGLTGIEAGRRMLQQNQCGAVVLLTMHNEPYLLREALQAGILGYVLKLDATEELVPAIYDVLNGRRYVSRRVSPVPL